MIKIDPLKDTFNKYKELNLLNDFEINKIEDFFDISNSINLRISNNFQNLIFFFKKELEVLIESTNLKEVIFEINSNSIENFFNISFDIKIGTYSTSLLRIDFDSNKHTFIMISLIDKFNGINKEDFDSVKFLIKDFFKDREIIFNLIENINLKLNIKE